VPHISITVAFVLVVVDLAVLIYFINHIANEIQLPQVIASIAEALSKAVGVQCDVPGAHERLAVERGPALPELLATMTELGAVIATPRSGYLQFIRHQALVRIAARVDAVIHLPYRPGHFLVQGHPLAVVLPPEAAAEVANTCNARTSPGRTAR
jgi:uncharacterized membrane protein